MADMRSHQMRGIDGVPPFLRFQQESEAIFAEYGAESIAELPVYVGALRLQKFEEYDFPVFEQHYGQLRDSYTDQRRLQDRIGFVAPNAAACASLSMTLAGTDLIRAYRVCRRCRNLPARYGDEDQQLPWRGLR